MKLSGPLARQSLRQTLPTPYGLEASNTRCTGIASISGFSATMWGMWFIATFQSSTFQGVCITPAPLSTMSLPWAPKTCPQQNSCLCFSLLTAMPSSLAFNYSLMHLKALQKEVQQFIAFSPCNREGSLCCSMSLHWVPGLGHFLHLHKLHWGFTDVPRLLSWKNISFSKGALFIANEVSCYFVVGHTPWRTSGMTVIDSEFTFVWKIMLAMKSK